MRTGIYKLLAFAPMTSRMRGGIYRILNHRNISKGFRIGFGSYIDAKTISIGHNVCIGNMTRAKLLDRFTVGNDTTIGSNNIICGTYENNKFGERDFSLGSNTEILYSHYFDVVAPIVIGNHVTIAGKWTQFYTHSFDLSKNRLDGGIVIGNNVYIGAGSLINLGVDICDNVVISGGCVVSKDIVESGVYNSSLFKKRGEVRNYADNNSGAAHKQLASGIMVYSRDKHE